MTGDEFKIMAMRQVFGGVIEGLVWHHLADSYTPAQSPVMLQVEISLLQRHRGSVNRSRGLDVDPDGGVAGAEGRAHQLAAAPASAQKSALLAEIDRRYHAATGTPPGTPIPKGEAGPAALWRTLRDEVLFQHEYLGHLPERVNQLIRRSVRDRELSPADYDQLFRIAKRIERMPPGQAADYASRITATTTDLNAFERDLEKYTQEMASRSRQAEEREDLQLKLLGLEGVYQQYRQYRGMLKVESVGAGLSAVLPGSPMATNFGLHTSMLMAAHLDHQLHRHGFASLADFEGFITRFERAFERESAAIALDLLAKYAGRLYRESERYRDPAEVAQRGFGAVSRGRSYQRVTAPEWRAVPDRRSSSDSGDCAEGDRGDIATQHCRIAVIARLTEVTWGTFLLLQNTIFA